MKGTLKLLSQTHGFITFNRQGTCQLREIITKRLPELIDDGVNFNELYGYIQADKLGAVVAACIAEGTAIIVS